MYLLRILLFLPLLPWACDSDSGARIEGGDLTGTWNWVSTSGGLTGRASSTPATTGTTVQLELGADNRYTITENGTEVSRGTYSVALQKSIYSTEEQRFITYADSTPAVGVVFSGVIQLATADSLVIADNVYDGFGSTFVQE